MKRISFLLFAALTAALGTLHADLTIVQKIDGMAGMANESTTKIKGNKMRVDAVPGMSILMDGGTGEMTNLLHTQKSYMKLPADLIKSQMAGAAKDAGPAKPTLTPTGKKDTINGYPCEEYTTEIAGHKVTLWLTTAIPNYQAVLKELSAALNSGPLAATMQNFNVYTDNLPGFPIRTSNEVAPGQTMTSTIVSIDTKAVPDSEFALPAGYKEMTLPVLTPPAPKATPATK